MFGTVYFGLMLYWLLLALIWFTKLAILAFLATLGVLVVMTTIFAWLLHHGVHRVRAPLWLALPVTWTAMEWARASLPSTLSFPWLGLGTSLTGFPELVGVAEIVGARGVTFWVALVNGLVAGVLLRIGGRRRWRRELAAIVLVVGLPMGWGVWRAETIETRSAARVAVVQPNVAEHLKLEPEEGRAATAEALGRLLPRIGPNDVDLVVLPEVTFPGLFPRGPEASDDLLGLQRFSREIGAPVLFGGLGYTRDGDDLTPYNSAFVMEPRGLTGFQYDKRFLVPIAERTPFAPLGSLGFLPYAGTYGVGDGWPLAEVDETRLGVLICYESAYPEASRAFRLEGADVLVNITNDAWYGREPLYTRTTALWQHPAHMVMRAIENRTGVARSANTGISLFVDPIGRVHGSSALFTEDVRIGELLTTDTLTFYTRYGDLLGTASAIVTLLLLVTSIGPVARRLPGGEP